MKLYLIQHGEAKSETEDPQRGLTERGREEIRKIGAAVKRMGIQPFRIYHSGKLRAEQTADILGRTLHCLTQADPGLGPKEAISPWVEKVNEHPTDLMIVGHLPFLEKLASGLITGSEDHRPLRFRYGVVYCLERLENHWGVCWGLTPEMVEALLPPRN